MSTEVLNLIHARKFDDAFRLADRLVEAQPDNVEKLILAGEAALHAQRNAEANEYAMRVLRLVPTSGEAFLISAKAFRRSQEFAEAERLLTAESRRYHFKGQLEGKRLQELGLLYLETGRIEQALKMLERAQRSRPTDVQLLCELGHVRGQLGQADASREAFERAYRLDPNYFLAIRNMASALLNAGDAEAGLKLAERAMDIDPDDQELATVWLLAATSSMSVDAKALLACHRQYSSCADSIGVVKPLMHRKPTANDGPRIFNIGYFSHHFHLFPLASFLPQILRAHDRTQFRVFALSMGNRCDDWTRTYVDCADEFHDLSTMSDLEAATRIGALGIDMVVDMSGYTSEHRFSVLRHRPASVQMSWLGYLASTGSSAIDYHLTDAQANPVGECDALFVEKLIRLPHSQYSYLPLVETAEPCAAPHERNGCITFGFFSASTKLNLQSIETFAKILRETPGSRIHFYAQSQQLRKAVQDVFAKAGVKRHRIVFLTKQVLPEYFSALSNVDILLDSFPFVGGTTICDALWMGVPAVSMFLPRGFGGASRSVLHAVGHPEWVATSSEAYIDIACRLAQDFVLLGRLRRELRGQMRASPLMDADATARALECAYRQVWETACTGEPPESMVIG